MRGKVPPITRGDLCVTPPIETLPVRDMLGDAEMVVQKEERKFRCRPVICQLGYSFGDCFARTPCLEQPREHNHCSGT